MRHNSNPLAGYSSREMSAAVLRSILFAVLAVITLAGVVRAQADLTRILRESSRVLQEMNLGALFMALQIIRITDGHFAFASAGMPPAVVYRAATGKVEAVSAPAPPLGVALPASYSVQKHPLAPGDVLLLMSDGLPERFNPAREMLGYEQVPSLLQALAGDNGTASTIVRRLVEAGEAWAEGSAQADDVTLLAIRRLMIHGGSRV
jgi:phosphoserine phosphatase RsbU/P